VSGRVSLALPWGGGKVYAVAAGARGNDGKLRKRKVKVYEEQRQNEEMDTAASEGQSKPGIDA
jgi:hypothetical protein